jgi:hypothetical protein
VAVIGGGCLNWREHPLRLSLLLRDGGRANKLMESEVALPPLSPWLAVTTLLLDELARG